LHYLEPATILPANCILDARGQATAVVAVNDLFSSCHIKQLEVRISSRAYYPWIVVLAQGNGENIPGTSLQIARGGLW
jgi:hypothetical protein